MFQRIWKKPSSVQFICADVPCVTIPETSGFSFVQNDLSWVKNRKLLDITGYFSLLFVELKDKESMKGENTTPYILLLRQMT